MRLRRLDLLRYGHFTGRSFEFPVSKIDFHIVFGLNEAGKSTALSAIADLLFGVPMHSRYNFLHDYSSMRIGAVIENGKESLEVVRRKGSKDTLLGASDLPFPGGESALRPFLAGADRPFFERMFSLDHVRLEAGGKEILEAKDEIGQMLFSAGTGIAGLRDRLTALSSEADGLWAAKRARHRKFYHAADKLKDAEKQRREQTLTSDRWQELKRAFECAEEAHANIECEFEKVFAKRTRLGRIRRVYHDVRRKAALERQIAELGKVVSLPEDARQLLEESEWNESKSSTQIEMLSGHLDEARKELGTLTYDEQLVLRADDIGQLHERRIEIRRGRADLPKRQAELDAAEADLRVLAAELGWQAKVAGELIALIPARTKLGVVRALLSRRGALTSDVENKTAMLKEAEAEGAKLQERLGAIEEPTDISRLEAVIRTVRESGDVTGRLRSADQHVKDAQERVDWLLSSLHPSLPSEKVAAEMQVPPQMGVQEHRDQVQDWERRSRELAQKIATVEGELDHARKIFKNAVLDEHAATIDDLQEARRTRDALWKLVKQKYIENVPISDDDAHRYADVLDDLATAYEPAMRTADELADRRFDNAEASGRLAEMSRNIGAQEDGLAQLRKQEETLIQEGKRLDTDWQVLWDQAPFKPLSPDAMLEWLKARDELLKAVERRAEATSVLEIQRSEEHEAKEGLLAELSSLGIARSALEDDTLPVVLERAESVRRQYAQAAEDKARLSNSLQEAATDIERRRRELARAKKAWLQWQEEWSAGLTELGLAIDSHPDAVSARIDVIEQMREKAGRINDLRHQRIDKINRDIADFESVVAKIVGELADDLASMAADDAVLAIERRLGEAQRIRALRENKEKDIEKIANDMRALKEDRQRARESVNYFKNLVGADTNDELRNAIEKSDTFRGLQENLVTTQQTLAADGDGLPVAELEAECNDIDIDQIVAQEETTAAELKALRDQLTTAAENRSQARDAFQVIDGNDAAARAEATRQEALTEIRVVSERYVRVRTSVMLLQWGIDRYRREKQAPLLKRAGELFAKMTGDSFKDLRVAYDENDHAHLTGLRPDGEVVDVPGLSSGTADQLYLALRIASIEDCLDRANALPFVADDLFVNFDNDRARSGFEVLQELSTKTQVLFFTHHLHLLDIARETLGDSISVVNLDEEQVNTPA